METVKFQDLTISTGVAFTDFTRIKQIMFGNVDEITLTPEQAKVLFDFLKQKYNF